MKKNKKVVQEGVGCESSGGHGAPEQAGGGHGTPEKQGQGEVQHLTGKKD